MCHKEMNAKWHNRGLSKSTIYRSTIYLLTTYHDNSGTEHDTRVVFVSLELVSN